MKEIQPIQAIHPVSDVVQLKNETASNEPAPILPKNEQTELSHQRIKEAVDKLNAHLLGKNAHFEISVHEKTNRIMVKLVDSENQQVIKEIPPEEVLDRIAHIWELTGLVIDKKE